MASFSTQTLNAQLVPAEILVNQSNAMNHPNAEPSKFHVKANTVLQFQRVSLRSKANVPSSFHQQAKTLKTLALTNADRTIIAPVRRNAVLMAAVQSALVSHIAVVT